MVSCRLYMHRLPGQKAVYIAREEKVWQRVGMIDAGFYLNRHLEYTGPVIRGARTYAHMTYNMVRGEI